MEEVTKGGGVDNDRDDDGGEVSDELGTKGRRNQRRREVDEGRA